MMLNASKSSIGEVIFEQDNECDLLPNRRIRRRKSTSVDGLKSVQSGAVELYPSTITANTAVKMKTNKN